MKLAFTKMHGAGNDFVVLDGRAAPLALTPAQLALLADRRRGIGCDQVLTVAAPRGPDEDACFLIHNPDGSEAEQCGNGARCVARWLAVRGALAGGRLRLGSKGGVVALELLEGDAVRATMGVPELEPARVPFEAPARAASYALDVAGRRHEVGVLSMGNPHAVLRVAEVASAPVAELGAAIERHPRFPQRANVGFMQRLAADRIRLRVFERGVGETLACGTGACAAVVWGRLVAELGPRVAVELPGGTLVVEWPGDGAVVTMTGPTATVFSGEIEL
jgi:diaminopimelate epimerase